MQIIQGKRRIDILEILGEQNNLCGIELGVAGGNFAKQLLESNKFNRLFGIDLYAGDRSHDTAQYIKALQHMGIYEQKWKLLRMSFNDALSLFDDNSLDFVYVDGYAHTGENGGQTIYEWFKKVKFGGVIAGDDYHQNWPLVIKAVDQFISDHQLKLYINNYEDILHDIYPSWAAIKVNEVSSKKPPDWLIKESQKSLKKSSLLKRIKKKLKRIL